MERLIPKGDPEFAFLEHGDEQYKPLLPIRVAVTGQVFVRAGDGRAELLEHITVEDVRQLIKERGKDEYQQYDCDLISMNAFEKIEKEQKKQGGG